jgi:hypothetical protein
VLGLDAGDGAVLIVGLGGILHIGNSHGCSNESKWTKVQDQWGYLVEHGLHRHLPLGRTVGVVAVDCAEGWAT